jgi:hypothetical protein
MVKDKEELYVQMFNLLSDEKLARSIGERAFSVIAMNSGAAKKTIDAVNRLIIDH